MMDQQELEIILPHPEKLLRVSHNRDAVDGGGDAGGHRIGITFDLNDAEPARAYGKKIFVKAECGNVDIIFPRSLKDRFALRWFLCRGRLS